MLKHIKNSLSESILSVLSHSEQFICHPDTQFTRRSRLAIETMVHSILGMGGKTLSKELLDLGVFVSNSAFVQRRYHIKHDLFKALFQTFTDKIPKTDNLPILAVDGSDVCIPRNTQDYDTCIFKRDGSKPYNLIHLNALFDLKRGIYVDTSVQDKRKADENGACAQMIQASPFRQSTCHYG